MRRRRHHLALLGFLVAGGFFGCTARGEVIWLPCVADQDCSPEQRCVEGLCRPGSPTDENCIALEGIWLSRNEILQLPTSGAAWLFVFDTAQLDTSSPDLTSQIDDTDSITMAKALVYARTGESRYAEEVKSTLQALIDMHPIASSLSWDAISTLRALGPYVIAADLIDLAAFDSTFDTTIFRPWLDAARHADLEGSSSSVIRLQEKRPNYWGAQASASRIAVALYLEDDADLARAVQVLRGYLGDRSAYAEFTYGTLNWQADPAFPVPVNPAGSMKDGHNIDGMHADDQRVCSDAFVWPPCADGRQWEALQGAVAAAQILDRRCYNAFEWEDQSILRTVEWLHDTLFDSGANRPAVGDDIWVIWVINKHYDTAFPSPATTMPGKMVGWTDWTHQ